MGGRAKVNRDWGFRVNSKYFRILILLSSFIFVLLPFQNCSSSFSTGPSSRTSTNKSGGNGTSYDGKLTLHTPDAMAPDQPIEVTIEGGTPPYQLTSSSSDGNFVEVNPNTFLYNMNDTSKSSVEISVVDQAGNFASKTVLILGVNRWYFDGPEQIIQTIQGSYYILEQSNQVTSLSQTGDVLKVINLKNDFGVVDFSAHSMALNSNQDHLILLDQEKREMIDLDLTSNSKKVTGLHSLVNSSSCNMPGKLILTADDSLAMICNQPAGVYVYNPKSSQGQFIKASVESSSHQITDIDFVEGTLFLTTDAMYLLKIQLGTLLQEKLALIGEKLPVDVDLRLHQIAIRKDGMIYSMSLKNKRIFIFNPEGMFTEAILSIGDGDGELRSPSDVIFSSDGKLVTTDRILNRIQFFNSSGDFLYGFGPTSSQSGTFYKPKSLKYSANGDLYVLDTGNSRIQIFNKDGSVKKIIDTYDNFAGGQCWECLGLNISQSRYLSYVDQSKSQAVVYDMEKDTAVVIGGTKGLGPYSFDRPGSAMRMADGRIVVADTYNHRLVVYSESGTFLRSISSQQLGGISFSRPLDLEWDEDSQKLYVLSSYDSQIFIFDDQFNLLKTISNTVSFRYAKDLTLDQNKNIYIADTVNNQILILNPQGEFLDQLDNSKLGLRPLNQPMGLAISGNGRLAIADTMNHRIQILPLPTLD